MTSKTHDVRKTHHFLLIRYPQRDFLINRNQVLSSMYLDKEIKIKSADPKGVNPLFSSCAQYGLKTILMFDLHGFLLQTFRCGDVEYKDLVLIVNAAGFSDSHRRIVSGFLALYKDYRPDPGLVGIKVNNQSQIHHIQLNEIKLIPPCLREAQRREGILGVRFSDGKIQYFIDNETILINSISRSRGKA